MLQYAFYSSEQRFPFTIKSSSQALLYIDYGPDPHHYFSGSCCKGGACYVKNVYEWSYSGSCSTSCPTYAAIANLGSQTTNVAIYGKKPM